MPESKKTRLPNLWHVIVHSNYLIILLRFQLSRYLMALILHMKSNTSANEIEKERESERPTEKWRKKKSYENWACAVSKNIIWLERWLFCDELYLCVTKLKWSDNNNTIKLQWTCKMQFDNCVMMSLRDCWCVLFFAPWQKNKTWNKSTPNFFWMETRTQLTHIAHPFETSKLQECVCH